MNEEYPEEQLIELKKKLEDIKEEIEKSSFDESAKIFDEALEIARGIKVKSWRSKALSSIASEMAKAGMNDEATSIFDEALEIARGIEYKVDQGKALSSIASEMAKAGRYDEALKIALRIEYKDWQSEALSSIASEMVKAGRYNEALEIARGIKVKSWQSEALSSIASEMVKAGRYNETPKIIKKIQELKSTFGKNEQIEQNFENLLNSIERGKNYKEDLEKLLANIDTEIEKLKPIMDIKVPVQEFVLHRWEEIPLIIKNTGNTLAKNIKISFSKELEAKETTAFDLEAGEKREIEINAKALEVGKVPVEVKAEYERWDGKKYETSQIFTISVNEYDFAKTQEESTKEEIKEKEPKPISSFPSELLQFYEGPALIGQGGFARVFKAKRKKDGRNVAIKVPISMDSSTGKSFIKEIENWTKLKHDNIIEVYDYNVLPIPYFEMELCDKSLEKMKKPMDIEKASWIVFSIAEGLKYAHNRNVAHLDLKPKNVMLKEGMPKISDWGLSRAITESRSSSIQAFSPLYASPEHISKKFGKKDERTDIWQLGVIFYELVTGRLPFEGDDFIEISANIVNGDPIPLSKFNKEASKVEPIIERCLQKKKGDRYPDIEKLQKDLAEVLNIEYKAQLKKSIQKKNLSKSAYYCGELLMVNLKIGDIYQAYKYASDLTKYATDNTKKFVDNLCKELKERIENKIEVNEELIKKVDIMVHKIKIGGIK